MSGARIQCEGGHGKEMLRVGVVPVYLKLCEREVMFVVYSEKKYYH